MCVGVRVCACMGVCVYVCECVWVCACVCKLCVCVYVCVRACALRISICFFVFLRVSFPLSMQSFDRSFCGSSFTIFVSTSSSLSCIYLVRECLFHKLSFLFLFLIIHIFISNGAYHHQCLVLISRALMCLK